MNADDEISDSTRTCVSYMNASALFCDMALFGVLSPILPYLFHSSAISASQLSILFMSKAAAEVVSLPFSGYAVDVIGPRACMGVGLILCALTSFMLAWTFPARMDDNSKYTLVIVWRSLSGMASSLIGPSSGALVSLTSPSNDGGASTGRSFGAMGFGMVLGMVGGPCLANLMEFGSGVPFLIIGFICLVVLALHAYISSQIPSHVAVGANTHDQALRGAWQLVRDPYLWCCVTPLLAAVSVEGLVTVGQPLHLAYLKQGPGESVQMFTVFGLVALISGFMYPRFFADKLSCPRHIILGGASMIFGVALLFLNTDLNGIAVGNAVAGFSLTPIRFGSFLMLSALVQLRELKVFGFAMACQSIMACLGYLLGPSIAALFGTCWKCIAIAAGTCLGITSILPHFAQPIEDYRREQQAMGAEGALTKDMESAPGYKSAEAAPKRSSTPVCCWSGEGLPGGAKAH